MDLCKYLPVNAAQRACYAAGEALDDSELRFNVVQPILNPLHPEQVAPSSKSPMLEAALKWAARKEPAGQALAGAFAIASNGHSLNVELPLDLSRDASKKPLIRQNVTDDDIRKLIEHGDSLAVAEGMPSTRPWSDGPFRRIKNPWPAVIQVALAKELGHGDLMKGLGELAKLEQSPQGREKLLGMLLGAERVVHFAPNSPAASAALREAAAPWTSLNQANWHFVSAGLQVKGVTHMGCMSGGANLISEPFESDLSCVPGTPEDVAKELNVAPSQMHVFQVTWPFEGGP